MTALRRDAADIIRHAIRVRIHCTDGTDHTTYYDPSPTQVTLGHLLLDKANSDKNGCGPHVVLVDTVPRADLAAHTTDSEETP